MPTLPGQNGGMIPQAGDCETIHAGLLAQPVDALSALGFVGAGVWVAARATDRDRRWYGVLLASVGASSLLFHASAQPWTAPIESATVVALATWLGASTGARLGRTGRLGWIAGAATATALMVAFPASRHVVTGLAIGFAAVQLFRSPHRRRALPGLGLLAAGLLVYASSSTGGPLCFPDSPLQGHAVWHLLAAAGLTSLGSMVGAGATSGATSPG